MKKFLLLPTMAVAAVLMLNSCELFCEQYAELCCETECPEEITSILVYLQPFTVPGTRATDGGQTKITMNDAGVQSFSKGDQLVLVYTNGATTKLQAVESGNPALFKRSDGQPLTRDETQLFVFLVDGNKEVDARTRFRTEAGKIIVDVTEGGDNNTNKLDLSPYIQKVGTYDQTMNAAYLKPCGGIVETAFISDKNIRISSVEITTDESFMYYLYEDDASAASPQLTAIEAYSIKLNYKAFIDLLSGSTSTMDFAIPMNAFTQTTKATIAIQLTQEGSSDNLMTFIETPVSCSVKNRLPAENFADLDSYKMLNTWNETTKKYSYESSYQIPTEPESYCFDATVKGNDEGTISPVSVAVISQEPTTSFDGSTTPGNVVTDVTLAGNGMVTFTSTGIPGRAVIGVYNATGDLLTSWTIECAPR